MSEEFEGQEQEATNDADEQASDAGNKDHQKVPENWNADTALDFLVMERAVNPSESTEEMARRLFHENLPTAVASIVHTAIHSPNEKTRLDASKYVVERVLGKIGMEQPDDGKSPWESLLANVVTSGTNAAENFANQAAPAGIAVEVIKPNDKDITSPIDPSLTEED